MSFYCRFPMRRELLEEMKSIFESHLIWLKVASGYQEQYTRYLTWVDSLISDRPFHVVAAEWYRGFQKIRYVK